MRKVLFILGLIFVFLSLFFWQNYFETKSIELKKPEWKNYTLDNESARRFVSLAYDSQTNPYIFYFAEMTGEGIKLFYSNNTLEDYYNKGRVWHTKLLKSGKDVGFFISADSFNDSIFVSFQDYRIANEKLFLTKITKNSSQTFEVDGRTKSGLNAGMYSSICLVNGKPYLIYHVEEGRKLMLADPNLNLKLLETGTGWNIDCVSDNKTIFVGYRGRDDMNLRLGTYDISTKSWNSKGFDINVSSLALFLWNSTPYIVYYNHDDKGIYLSSFTNFNPRKIEQGYETMVDADTSKDQVYILYSTLRDGLFLLNSSNLQNFTKTQIASGAKVGLFNSIKVTPNNDIQIAYIDGNSLIYKEFEVSPYLYKLNEQREKLKNEKFNATLVSSIAFVLILVSLIKIPHF